MSTVYCHSIANITWENSFHDSFLIQDEIHVWRIPVITDEQLLDEYKIILDPYELDRAMAFRQEKDRRRFITSQVALRFLLGKYLKRKPADLHFSTEKNKKPILKDISPFHLHYNISHSGEWILIVIADTEIGIDIEKIDDRFEYAEILPTAFSQAEIDSLKKQKEPRIEFYLYWTRKEAMSKATGKGIDDQLKMIPCLDGLHNVSDEVAGLVRAWTVLSFRIHNQYISSLAYDSVIRHLKFLDFNILSLGN